MEKGSVIMSSFLQDLASRQRRTSRSCRKLRQSGGRWHKLAKLAAHRRHLTAHFPELPILLPMDRSASNTQGTAEEIEWCEALRCNLRLAGSALNSCARRSRARPPQKETEYNGNQPKLVNKTKECIGRMSVDVQE